MAGVAAVLPVSEAGVGGAGGWVGVAVPLTCFGDLWGESCTVLPRWGLSGPCTHNRRGSSWQASPACSPAHPHAHPTNHPPTSLPARHVPSAPVLPCTAAFTLAPPAHVPPCSRIMWVDSKKLRVSPGKLRVIGRRGKVLAVVEHPLISSSGKSVTLNYYAVVNAILGAVAIKFVTGTTGLRRRYKVRTCWYCHAAPACACPAPPSAPHPQLPWWAACSCCCTSQKLLLAACRTCATLLPALLLLLPCRASGSAVHAAPAALPRCRNSCRCAAAAPLTWCALARACGLHHLS